jgi:hypothetical protein
MWVQFTSPYSLDQMNSIIKFSENHLVYIGTFLFLYIWIIFLWVYSKSDLKRRDVCQTHRGACHLH